MTDLLELTTTFVNAIALIMALVLMISILKRYSKDPVRNAVLIGGLFSFALFVTMFDPIDLGPKGVYDLRGLLIGAAAALFGPIVGLMTMVTGLALRWSTGGAGLNAGLIGIVLACASGLAWRHFVYHRFGALWKESILLGLMISIHLTAIFVFPSHMWGDLFTGVVPPYLAANILGALFINYLIGAELSFLSEAETSRINANTDHLTGLLNRRGLELTFDDTETPADTRYGRALLYFDVDRFKATNDNYGHAVGDDVLRHVVNLVAANLRMNDTFVRLGGDEFAVILPDIDAKEAKAIAERCREVVSEAGFEVGHDDLAISISVGAVWMRSPVEINRMLEVADRALYQAKAKGRNAVVFLAGLSGAGAPMGAEIGVDRRLA